MGQETMSKDGIKTAFVAGAGLGKRLRPLTANRPKPLVPLYNRPLITYVFDALLAVGIERIVVNTHHCPQSYEEILRLERGQGTYRGMQIECIYEPVLLETGGGIKNAARLFGDEPVLVHNGDIFASVDLPGLLHAHTTTRPAVTAHLRSFGGPLQVSYHPSTKEITDFRGVLERGSDAGFLFSGIYIIEPAFIRRIPPGTIISVVPVFLDMLRAGVTINGFLDDSGVWADLGNRDAYLDAHATVPRLAEEGRISVDPSAEVSASATLRGFVAIGAHAVIGDRAVIQDSVIWEGAKIASDAQLLRCIVRDHQSAQGILVDKDI